MSENIDRSILISGAAGDLTSLRHRLEAQSFLNQSNDLLLELKHWWRFTPTLNWIVTLVATVMAWPQILYAIKIIMIISFSIP